MDKVDKATRYRSVAQWPKESVSLGNHENTSSDEHDTRSAAEAVCRWLKRNGLGGNREVFPVKTWIEPIE